MREKKIKFTNADDAREFLSASDNCDFDIDILYDHIILDGKSIMALMSMDLSKPVTVKYCGENPHFESLLENLAIQ